MVIDIFKGSRLYTDLKPHNNVILDVCKGFDFISNRKYDTTRSESSWWFSPKMIRQLPISHVYPKCLPVQEDPRMCLYLYAPNYLSLMLINKLYKGKDIIIEDQASGMGRLSFYLNKLGFQNFSFIDNFCQLCPELFSVFMFKTKMYYTLNDYTVVSDVLNLVGLPYFVKRIYPQTELVLTYNRTCLIKEIDGKLFYRPDKHHYSGMLEMNNKVFLCKDQYDMMNVYCNADKYDEFKSKIEEFKI